MKVENIKQKVIDFFGYFDKREFSDRGVLLNWAISIEVVEFDLEKNTYFPTFVRKIDVKQFNDLLFQTYKDVRDEKTLRSEIYKVRSRVCKNMSIPNRIFDNFLEELNTKIPHFVNLERAPSASFRSPDYGLIKENGEIYYYLRIMGDINEQFT